MIYFITVQYIVDNAYPPIMPVINRRIFVDSRMPNRCISQSASMTTHPIKQNCMGRAYMRNIVYAMMLPINTPVHLAHMGNCLPFILKLRSGIW